MSGSKSPFVYARLRDLGFDRADPEVILEVGTDRPVDWEQRAEEGHRICDSLLFALNVPHAGDVRITCRFARLVMDAGYRDYAGIKAYVYILGIRPAVDDAGRETNLEALETAVGESVNVRRRKFCEDVDRLDIYWDHRGPEHAARIENCAYEPEPVGEAPSATDDEVAKLCDAFDAFCMEIDPVNDSSIPMLEAEFDLEDVPVLAYA